jgi:hypothetical protein
VISQGADFLDKTDSMWYPRVDECGYQQPQFESAHWIRASDRSDPCGYRCRAGGPPLDRQGLCRRSGIQKKIERELAKESEALRKSFLEQCLSEYACEADARAAAQAWASQASSFHDLSFEIEPHFTYARGRPKKGQPRAVAKVAYRVHCHLAHKASALEQMRLEAGCFVLLTNVAGEGDGAIDAKEILSLYKEQHGVEQNFAFLKGPAVVNTIFLKSEERIEALGLILLISLLIWRLIERSLRKHVEETGHPLTGWDNKPTTSPTALMVTSKFKNTTVIRIGSHRRLSRPLNPVQLEWLEALGLKTTIFTLQPRAG